MSNNPPIVNGRKRAKGAKRDDAKFDRNERVKTQSRNHAIFTRHVSEGETATLRATQGRPRQRRRDTRRGGLAGQGGTSWGEDTGAAKFRTQDDDVDLKALFRRGFQFTFEAKWTMNSDTGHCRAQRVQQGTERHEGKQTIEISRGATKRGGQ